MKDLKKRLLDKLNAYKHLCSERCKKNKTHSLIWLFVLLIDRFIGWTSKLDAFAVGKHSNYATIATDSIDFFVPIQ